MKKSITIFYMTISVFIQAQKSENMIIITTDGLRWQDVFRGMDSAIADSSKLNEEDSSHIYKAYWDNDETERRKKLFPFLWSIFNENGQIYGNRKYVNKVNVANPYKISYPGYNEMMTGFADTSINSNDFPPNPHVTVLEFLNQQSKFKGKVAAFGAWDAFDRILNEERSGIPVVSAFQPTGGRNPNANERLINAMLKDSYKPFGDIECLDVFTHYAAMEHLKTKKPKILYISYGETDEWAHHGHYRSYLDAARQVDAWIKQIWNFVQTDPQYKDKTSLLFTTDHGRGKKDKGNWADHGKSIEGSSEIWVAVMGPGVPALGEVKSEMQLFQDQFAQTISKMLGYIYKSNHPVAEEIKQVFK